jgi:Zn-dependent protease with chaperone function
MVADNFGKNVLLELGYFKEDAISALEKMRPFTREKSDMFRDHPNIEKRIAVLRNPKKFLTTF